MTRIVAGTARGRRLSVPTADVRPTASRTREAIFSAVGHQLGGWADTRVLDLFAGSGAMGLEAASRGAASVLLVERDRRVLKTLRANAAVVDCPGVQILSGDAYLLRPRAEQVPGFEAADVAILDPPYRDDDDAIAGLLTRLLAGDWFAPDALAVVERPVRGADFSWPRPWETLANRRYADTVVHIGGLVASPQRP